MVVIGGCLVGAVYVWRGSGGGGVPEVRVLGRRVVDV